MRKIFRYKKVFLSLGVSIGILFSAQTVDAAYGNLPTFLVGPDYQYVNISDVEPGSSAFGANLPISDTKLYTNALTGGDRTVSVYIDNLSATNDCSGYRIKWDIIRLDSNGDALPGFPIAKSGIVNSSMASQCSATPFPITFNDTAFTPSGRPDLTGVAVTRLRLTILANDINGPKHTAYLRLIAPSSPDTRIAYTASGPSTIYPWLDTNSPYTLSWQFRPSCNSNSATPILWQDDDAYPSGPKATHGPRTSDNQTIPLEVRLYTYDQLGNLIETTNLNNYLIGRSDIASSIPPPHGVWNNKYKYRLEFSNVEWGNGIAVTAPFDSGDFDFPCPREFDTTGNSSLVFNDPENPTVVTAGGTINRNGKETDAPITSATLRITRNGVTVPGSQTSTSGWAGNISFSSPFNAASGVRALGWNVGDQICAVLNYTYKSGWVIPGTTTVVPPILQTNSGDIIGGCRTLVNMPYVRFYGQDVFAGGNFDGEASASTGRISTNYRTPNLTTGTYAGSGVEYAAFSLDLTNSTSDKGFASSSLRDVGSLSNQLFDQLNFASSPKGLFGGNHIATDYFGDKPDNTQALATNTASLSTLATKTSYYRNTGGGANVLTIDNGANFTGSKTIYVDGDVYINSNIEYTPWGADITAIPSFRLIVKGNIYISPNVTRIDGFLVAQPTAGNKGLISTCANADGGNADPAELTTTATGIKVGAGGDCSTQLVINGAIVAHKVKWLRTYKTLSDAKTGGRETYNDNNAAEIINSSPELYLGIPAGPPSSGGTSGKYDSYQALPPIL